jgi:GT2 family glycosyltransferase
MDKDVIAIVIVNYKTTELIFQLLQSISEENIQVKIFILDNESLSYTWDELLKIQDERIILLRSLSNLGFAGGVNYVIKHIKYNYSNINYFFLLNPDALCTPNLIFGLKQALHNNSNAACISPKIFDKQNRIWYSGAKINFSRGTVYNNFYKNYSGRLIDVDVFSGCAVLFEINKFIEAGMFDERLFMYYDEADLSINLKRIGYDILYFPGQQIIHDVSYSTKNISYMKTYYMTRNRLKVFKKDISILYSIYSIIFEFLFHLKNKRIKNAIFHLRGVLDFIKGNFGKYKSSFS